MSFTGYNNKLANVPTITGLSNVIADEIITDDLVVNGIDIGTAISDLQQITTGITYDSGTDTTEVDNNITATGTITAPTFDGTATKVNLANTATGSTNYLVMSTTNSGSSNLITDNSGAMYDSTSNSATINITGRSGSVSILPDDTGNTRFLTFVEASTGSQTVRIDNSTTPLTYRPDTSVLTASTFDGTATKVNLTNGASGVVNYMVFSATNSGSSSLLTDVGGDAFYDNTTNTASINISGKAESVEVADYDFGVTTYPAFVLNTGDQQILIDKTATSLTYRPDVGLLTTETITGRSSNSSLGNVYMGRKNGASSFFIVNNAGFPALTTGDFNTAIGGLNGIALETGSNNFSMGYNCMLGNKVGSNNCLMGHRAGYQFGSTGTQTANSYNTAVGDSTLTNAITTQENTCIGGVAGSSMINGNFRCTCIGYNANCADGLSYATAIGAFSSVTTSNTLQLGRNTDNVNCPNTLSVASNVTASTAPTLGGHLCNKTYVDSTLGSYVTTNTAQNITANKTFYGSSLLIDDGTGDNTSISQVNQITVFDNNNPVNTTTSITGIIPSTSLNKIIPTTGSNPTSAQILQTTVTGTNIPLQNNRYFVSAHTYNAVFTLSTLGQPANQIQSVQPMTVGMFITSGLGTNFSNGTYITADVGVNNQYTINQPALNTTMFKINHNVSMITTNISLAAAITAGTINFRNDGAFQFLCNNTSGTEIMPLQINSTDVQVNASLTVNNACMYGRDDQFAFTSVPSGAPTQPIGYTAQYSETAVTFTSGTVFNYTTVLPLLDNGVWIVTGTLTLNQGTGSYSGGPYVYIRMVAATGSDFYPTTGNGNRVILPTSTATPVVAPFFSTLIVKSATQVRAAIQGQIVMTVGTATKALNVAFTKIA